MTSGRKCHRQAVAVCVLAAGLLTGGRLPAADGNRLAWAPNREDAVVIEDFPVTAVPRESALSKSVASRRPHSLSRPAPTRSQAYIASAPATEVLPSISGAPLTPEGLPVPPEMYYDESGGVIQGEMPGCSPGCGPCFLNRCGTGWGFVPLCIGLPLPPLDGLEAVTGVQGFTGPANRGGSGSFGTHAGFNWGIPLCGYLGGQWGANWTQSNFEGNYLTTDTRNQVFATAGLYRRVDWGFQGGLVVDFLHDEWDYNADLTQLRGELSWLWCGQNEIGFWFAAGINDSENLVVRRPVFGADQSTIRFVNTQATLEVNDMYALFFRRQFACGGSGRMFVGLTGNGQGLIGGDSQVPLNPRWSLRTSFLYAEPGDSDGPNDPRFTRESWNVGISLVWTPCPRDCCGRSYSRPLFNVADNGTFITRLLPRP